MKQQKPVFIRVCLSKRTQNLPPPAPCHTPYAACIRPPEPHEAAAQAEHRAGSCEGRGCRRRVALGWRKAETRIVLLGEPLTGSCSPEGFEATGGCAAWRWAAPQSAQPAPGHPQASQHPGPHVGRRPHVRHRPHIGRRPHSHPRPRITPGLTSHSSFPLLDVVWASVFRIPSQVDFKMFRRMLSYSVIKHRECVVLRVGGIIRFSI